MTRSLPVFFIEAGGEPVGSVFAFAAAKDVVLLKQEDTRFYPPDWVDVFVPDVAFDIDVHFVALSLLGLVVWLFARFSVSSWVNSSPER
jgi:hypothetical protein